MSVYIPTITGCHPFYRARIQSQDLVEGAVTLLSSPARILSQDPSRGSGDPSCPPVRGIISSHPQTNGENVPSGRHAVCNKKMLQHFLGDFLNIFLIGSDFFLAHHTNIIAGCKDLQHHIHSNHGSSSQLVSNLSLIETCLLFPLLLLINSPEPS